MWVFHYHNMKKDEKMRVLIVEDERDLNHTIGKVLKKEGYHFDACYDGEEAWDYIEVYAYDVILLDIMMPRLDGLSLLKRIRQKGLQTKVILLTAKEYEVFLYLARNKNAVISRE